MRLPPSTPILDVRDLDLIRDGVRILSGVSWTVRRGEHWVILGANGSGKTSLLAALTGYLMPTSGTVDVLGRRYGESDWRELRTHIGWVSSSIRQMMPDEEPALWAVAGGCHAMIDYWGVPPRDECRRAMQRLGQVGCRHLAERPWGVLSQGERQRVLIARALMAHPRLLILDEPCAGLDPVSRESFLDAVETMARRPRAPSLILVTHHVEEIRGVFTQALALSGGRVVAAGEAEDVLTSGVLSRVFGVRLRLHRGRGGMTLKWGGRPRRGGGGGGASGGGGEGQGGRARQ